MYSLVVFFFFFMENTVFMNTGRTAARPSQNTPMKNLNRKFLSSSPLSVCYVETWQEGGDPLEKPGSKLVMSS